MRAFADWVLALFVVLVWGISYAVIRATVKEIPPLSLATLRFALASVLLWPAVRLRHGKPLIPREDRGSLFALGLFGVALYFGFENTALSLTTASHGALIIATVPLATALADAVRRRTWPRPALVAGLLVALAGVAVIVRDPHDGGANPLGDALMFGAVTSWVFYTFILRRMAPRYPKLVLAQATMVSGFLCLLPGGLVEWAVRRPGWPSAAAWGGYLFLAVFCSAVAYFLWGRAVAGLGVTATSTLLYGVPLVGVLSGVLMLGEPFTAAIALGGVLVVGGIVIATRDEAARAAASRD